MSVVKIWYSVQGTGLGHLTPYLALARALADRGHEVITFTCGPVLPSFFKPVGAKHYHFRGPTLIFKAHHRLSLFGTIVHNALYFPVYIFNLFRLKKLIQREKPDLVILDYEALTAIYLRLWRPSLPSFSVDHQSLFVSPMFTPTPDPVMTEGLSITSSRVSRSKAGSEPSPDLVRGFPTHDVPLILKMITRLFTFARVRLCSSFSDYGSTGFFISVPPMLREKVLSHSVTDDGSIVVYHSVGTWQDKELIKKSCPDHPKFIFYGYPHEVYRNLIFKPKGEEFLSDLAQCHLFITHCGFVSLCEALVMGKRVICQPLKGQLEQEWNARLLKAFSNVRVVDRVDYGNLEVDRIPTPDPKQTAWLTHGLERVLQYVLGGDAV